ncbi:MAG TPA: FHA domain-containing protein [Vicinamibacterales bacterium]|nr:FHA domain-containing protein [Vicinamibacterales bacterium]
MWVIRTEGTPPAPLAFRILPGSVKTLGRAVGADFVVDATLVSRVHCRITAGAAELEVEDLDSTNGTFVNGARVSRGILRSGDHLTVGDVRFAVEHRSGAAEQEPSARNETPEPDPDPESPIRDPQPAR